jgi:hypothetical protein
LIAPPTVSSFVVLASFDFSVAPAVPSENVLLIEKVNAPVWVSERAACAGDVPEDEAVLQSAFPYTALAMYREPIAHFVTAAS